MDLMLIAVILGIVEGITEFLPVSSTGHLIVFGNLLNFTGAKADTFEIFIQLGAILAVIVLYWRRFIGLIPSSTNNEGFKGWNGVVKLAAACLPAFIFGFMLHGFIKSTLFSTTIVACSLIVGGIILILVKERDEAKQNLDHLSLKDCILVGFYQCISLCPGVSRAGATIVGGMLTGLSKHVSAEFSFLLAVPTMTAAVGYDLFKSMNILSSSDLPFFSTGFIVSFVAALVVIKSFIFFLQRASLALFGWYRIIFGIIILMSR